MASFIKKNWIKFVFAMATFFWVGCSDDASSATGAEDSGTSSSGGSLTSSSEESSSSADTSGAINSSSSNSDPDEQIPLMSATVYGPLPNYNSSSSYVEPPLPAMSVMLYGVLPLSSSSSHSPEDSSVEFEKIQCVANETKLTCDDGSVYAKNTKCSDDKNAECKTVYIGLNGMKFDEDAFKSLYTIVDSNSSSGSDGTSSAFDSSSSNYDPDDKIPLMSATAYGIQPLNNSSCSSEESSSSAESNSSAEN